MMISYFATYILLTLLFCSMSFITGIIISHRNVGPLYAFEKYLDYLLKGDREDKEKKLILRASDNFKQLEAVAEKLRAHFERHD